MKNLYLYNLYPIIILCIINFPTLQSTAYSSESIRSDLQWLLREKELLDSSMLPIRTFLIKNNIPISTSSKSTFKKKSSAKIAVSSEQQVYECRIKLCPVDIGKKVIAPCGCLGSQEWIELSELNNMRRRDPAKWVTCGTCLQDFDMTVFQQYHGLYAGLITYTLDKFQTIRIIFYSLLAIVFIPNFLIPKFKMAITSGQLWQQYPLWSRVARMPLPMKLWAAKWLCERALSTTEAGERRLVLQPLVEWESDLLDRTVAVHTVTGEE